MTPAFLQNELVRAFCWTLIHSLWQGLALAAVTGIVLLLTRRSHAKKRYALLSGLFFLFLVVTIATFVREVSVLRSAGNLQLSSDRFVENALITGLDVQSQATNTVAVRQSWVKQFVDYFNTHAAMVVTIWFIIFFAKLVRLGGNLFYIQRLRSYKTQDPLNEWKEKIAALALKIGLTGQIRLLESAIVKVPVTMGVFKPLVLLPVGLLAHLPADEIEAILLHELAHIRRRDYFVNLLQSLAETIFFFNPALLWLSSLIRDERENCCDDIAISVTNNKTNFINALISFQEYHFAKPHYGMAFPGKKQQLLNRVKRIVSNTNKTLNPAEKSILGFGMAILLFFSFVTAQESLPKPPKKANDPEKTSDVSKLSKLSPAAQAKPTEPLQAMAMELVLTDTLPKLGPLGVPVLDATSPLAPLSAEKTGLVTKPDREGYTALLDKPGYITKPDKPGYAIVPDKPGYATKPDKPGYAIKLDMAQDTTTKDVFSQFSASSNDDGVTRVVTMEGTTRDGKKYTLKKVNNVLEAFSVNGKQIAPAEFSNYRKEIDMMEEAYFSRTVHAKARKEEARIKHQEQQKRHERDMALKLEKIKELHIREEAKRQLERVSERRLVEGKEVRVLSDSARKVFEWKVRESERQRIEHKMELQKHIDIQKEHQIDIQKKKLLHEQLDSLKKISVQKFSKKPFDIKKEEWMRARHEEDEARVKASAAVMRNIIDDLEKENVKIDSQKSWFALDPDKFIVDGKELTKEQHDRFKTKYLNKSGWGYYFGHVKVSGHGIFLDNKDVPAK